METIQYLLGMILKLVIVLFIAVFLLWLGRFFFPGLAAYFKGNGLLYTLSFDWLPAPKNRTLFASSTIKGFTYVPGPAYNGYGNAASGQSANVYWIDYTSGGSHIVYSDGTKGPDNTDQVFKGNTSSYDNRSLYIRNLSLYEGETVVYGQTFYGEARQEMFRNSVFPISIVDGGGRVVAVMTAINTGTWAAPGWARFQATVQNMLPRGASCTMLFYSSTQPVRVGLPVRCN